MLHHENERKQINKICFRNRKIKKSTAYTVTIEGI